MSREPLEDCEHDLIRGIAAGEFCMVCGLISKDGGKTWEKPDTWRCPTCGAEYLKRPALDDSGEGRTGPA